MSFEHFLPGQLVQNLVASLGTQAVERAFNEKQVFVAPISEVFDAPKVVNILDNVFLSQIFQGFHRNTLRHGFLS